MTQDNQFQGVSRLLNNMFFIPGKAAWMWLAVTTSFLAYQKAINTFTGEIPADKIWIAAIIVAVFAYLLLDSGIPKRLGIYLDYKGQTGPLKKFLNIVFIVTIIQVIGTTSASLWIASDAADYFTEEHKSHEYINQINQVRFDNNKIIASAEDNVKSLYDSANDRSDNAKKTGNIKVNSAIQSGNRWQRDSYKREGFNWIANRANKDRADHKYASRIQSAIHYRDSLIANEKNLIAVAEKNLTTLLQDTTTMASVGIIQAAEKSANQKYQTKLSRRTNIVTWADLFALFIGLISVYVSHLDRASRKEKIDPRTTLLIATMAIARIGKNWIDWLEEALNIDINGDGYIGANDPKRSGLKTPVPPSETTVPPVPKHPETTVPEQPKRTVVRAFSNEENPPVPETIPEQPQNVVPQHFTTTPLPPETPVLRDITPVPETPVPSVPEQPEQVIITKIVQAPATEVKKWIKYAKIYYGRSITSKTEETRAGNRKTYEDYKSLLLTTDKYILTEGPEKVVIKEV